MESHSLSWQATGGPGRPTRKMGHWPSPTRIRGRPPKSRWPGCTRPAGLRWGNGCFARELFATREDALRHAILLTDGQNTQFPGRLAAQAAPQAGDYPTGAWGAESRDYHICVDVEPGAAGQEMLAARVSLTLSTASGSQTLGRGLVRAIWTDDEALSTRISRHVAHYTGQAELAQAIQDGIEARKAGDEDTAAARLGRAVALAHESGNKDTAKLLAKVVDVIDPASGTIRLKAKVADADEMMLDTRSTKTVQVRK